MQKVRVFHYIESLDAFLVTDAYRAVATQLGLIEWTPVVWIGRLFTLNWLRVLQLALTFCSL